MAAGVAAIRWSNLQSVVVIDVALRALQVGVRISQSKACGAVIEGDGRPRGRVVAIRTVRRGEGWTGA